MYSYVNTQTKQFRKQKINCLVFNKLFKTSVKLIKYKTNANHQ